MRIIYRQPINGFNVPFESQVSQMVNWKVKINIRYQIHLPHWILVYDKLTNENN